MSDVEIKTVKLFNGNTVDLFAQFGKVYYYDGRKRLVGKLGPQCDGFKSVIHSADNGDALLSMGDATDAAIFQSPIADEIANAYNKGDIVVNDAACDEIDY